MIGNIYRIYPTTVPTIEHSIRVQSDQALTLLLDVAHRETLLARNRRFLDNFPSRDREVATHSGATACDLISGLISKAGAVQR